jgi:putative phosphonate metabolism protein
MGPHRLRRLEKVILRMRYAVYFTPPEAHPLTCAAATWLGRNAFNGGETVASSPRTDLAHDQWLAATAEPRRYGFHATMKAPFSLHPDMQAHTLHDAFRSFCQATAATVIPRLVLAQLGPFFALVPGGQCCAVAELGAACVEAFELFRAPLSATDMARRKPERLTARQRQHLERWGYPYVLDEFRFHMTLTGPIETADQPRMRAILEERFAPFIGQPLAIGHLALFVEEERGSPFKVAELLPLT